MEEHKKDYNNVETSTDQNVGQPNEVIPQNSEMSKRSRLNRHLEKEGKKTIAASLLGLILIVLILLKFGIPFIASLGFLSSQAGGSKQEKSDQNNQNNVFLAPPTINQTFSATSSANVDISGSSTTGKQVAIYLNGSVYKKIDIKSDGSFDLNISLSDGDNIVKAKSVEGAKMSDYSDPITITLKNTPPSLSLDTPHDGDTVKQSPINVGGKTDPDTKVTVNGFWAIVDSSGGYSYSINLQNGDNNITVDAIDSAGNKAEKTIKVTYSP